MLSFLRALVYKSCWHSSKHRQHLIIIYGAEMAWYQAHRSSGSDSTSVWPEDGQFRKRGSYTTEGKTTPRAKTVNITSHAKTGKRVENNFSGIPFRAILMHHINIDSQSKFTGRDSQLATHSTHSFNTAEGIGKFNLMHQLRHGLMHRHTQWANNIYYTKQHYCLH